MRIAIYTRVSSEEQVNNFSLSGQKEKLESFIKTQEDWSFSSGHFFTDEGISGIKPISERPGLNRLFEAAKRKEFDLVLVYKLDRFFRNTRLLLEAVNKLSEYGIGFKSLTETFDTSNPMGQFMLTSLAAVAQLERDNIIDRMELGIEKAARSGVWMGGGVPFGYTLNKDTKRLELNEDEAKIVQAIYDYFLEGNGQTMCYVQNRINALNIPTRFDRENQIKRSAPNWWNKRTIHRILTNPVYTGKFEFRRKIGSNRGGDGGSKTLIIIEVPIIIDIIVFDKAREIIQRNKERAARNAKRVYLFNKIIKCGECGRAMVGTTAVNKLVDGRKAEHKYYRCTSLNSHTTPIRCNQRPVREAPLDEAIWGKLLNVISRPEIVYREIEYRLQVCKTGQVTKKQIEELTQYRESTKEKLKRAKELYIEGSLDKSEYSKRETQLSADIRRQEDRISEAKTVLRGLPPLKDFRESVKRVFNKYLDRLYELQYDDRAFIIHQLVSSIKYAFGEVEVAVLLPSCGLSSQRGVGQNRE